MRAPVWSKLSWGQFNRQLAKFGSTGTGRPRAVTDLEDLLSRPEWEGSTVESTEQTWIGMYPTALVIDPRGKRRDIRAEGPAIGGVREVRVVRHPSGATATIYVPELKITYLHGVVL